MGAKKLLRGMARGVGAIGKLIGRKTVKGVKRGSRALAPHMPGLMAVVGSAVAQRVGGKAAGKYGAKLGYSAGTSLRKKMRVQKRR